MGFDDFPPEYRTLCEHIGHLSMSWSLVESALDRIILHLHRYRGGEQIGVEIPRAFNRKPPYIRKVFSSHADFAQCLRDVEPLLIEATRLSHIRNRLIHSAVTKSYEGRFKLMFLNSKMPEQPIEEIQPDHQSIEFAAADCTLLFLNLINFSAIPLGAIPPDFVDDLYCKITGKNA